MEIQENTPSFKPRAACTRCWGRGYEGIDPKTRKKILCSCVKNSYLKANLRRKLIEEADTASMNPIDQNIGWTKQKQDIAPELHVIRKESTQIV